MNWQPDRFIMDAIAQGARSCARCLAERKDRGIGAERMVGLDGVWWYVVVCPEHGGWREAARTNVDAAIGAWNEKNDLEQG